MSLKAFTNNYAKYSVLSMVCVLVTVPLFSITMVMDIMAEISNDVAIVSGQPDSLMTTAAMLVLIILPVFGFGMGVSSIPQKGDKKLTVYGILINGMFVAFNLI